MKKNKVIGRTIKMNDEHHTQKREYDIISPEGALICTVTNIYNKQGLKDYKFKLGDPTIKVPSNMFNNEWKKRFFNMANRRFNKTAMSKGTKAKNAEKQAQNNALFNFLDSFQKD